MCKINYQLYSWQNRETFLIEKLHINGNIAFSLHNNYLKEFVFKIYGIFKIYLF